MPARKKYSGVIEYSDVRPVPVEIEDVPAPKVESQPSLQRTSRAVLSGPELMIGADPEFVLVNRAGNRMDCSSLSQVCKYGAIGDDHTGRCGEFRPAPGKPKDVVENIRQLMSMVRNGNPGKRIIAGGAKNFDMSCGGHIHFNIKNLDLADKEHTSRDGADQSLLHALDKFIGVRMLKMEGAARADRVNNQHRYGFPGDWRPQPHGFEYRTPPSFIGDPVLAEATFSVAYRVAKMWMANSNVFNDIGKKATKREYRILIPQPSEVMSTQDRDYWRVQIDNFVRIIFDPDYKLDNDDVYDRWLKDIPNDSELVEVPLSLNKDTDEGLNVSGYIMLPKVAAAQMSQMRICGLASWKNVPNNTVAVNKRTFDQFRLKNNERRLQDRGIKFIGMDSDQWDIMLPAGMRSEGSDHTRHVLDVFFSILGVEHSVDVD